MSYVMIRIQVIYVLSWRYYKFMILCDTVALIIYYNVCLFIASRITLPHLLFSAISPRDNQTPRSRWVPCGQIPTPKLLFFSGENMTHDPGKMKFGGVTWVYCDFRPFFKDVNFWITEYKLPIFQSNSRMFVSMSKCGTGMRLDMQLNRS